MINFELDMPTRIVFGKDTHKKIGELLKPYAKKLLLHYGGVNIKKGGLYDTVTAILKEHNINFVELGGVVPNPRISLIREGIKLCKKENVDCILAVGGGSVIDSSKAIAGGVFYDGDPWDLCEKRIPVFKALPVATLLTIPAAGSEMSGGGVITNEEKKLKLGCGGPALRPLLGVIDPQLFYTLPKNQIANGIADMMSHIFERYFTNTESVDLTDGYCETTLKTIMKYAPVVYRDATNFDAWSQIGFCGTMAHNNILGLGREQDWACHGMEHELSAVYDVAHGAGLAVLTPAWMKYVYKSNTDMFTQFAVKVMGVEGGFKNNENLILIAIDKLSVFFKSLGLPGTLADLGIDEKNFELMAKKATSGPDGKEFPLGGLKKLFAKDIVEIFRLAK
jgi:alcohol dehydrogenase YqhD (iron-dependent ADH family)